MLAQNNFMPLLAELPVTNFDPISRTSTPKTDESKIVQELPLLSPEMLKMSVPASDKCNEVVLKGRKEVQDVLRCVSDKLVVVVGPCSLHDPSAALEYCQNLVTLRNELRDDLVVVMRAYLEKPRTTVGWKGLINDPELNETFQINKGLAVSRLLFKDLTEMGMPIASEMLDTISPRYLCDLVSVGAVGARTTESQLHREMASGLPFPIGFKNGTDGSISVAADSIMSAENPHRFMGITNGGQASIIETSGNPDCFVILRGSTKGTNYQANDIKHVKDMLLARKQRDNIMIDCSHGNSSKNHNNQPKVADDVASQLRAGDESICGVMIESNLFEGKQSLTVDGLKSLKKGVSVTDACIDWTTTENVLRGLASAVRDRRKLLGSAKL